MCFNGYYLTWLLFFLTQCSVLLFLCCWWQSTKPTQKHAIARSSLTATLSFIRAKTESVNRSTPSGFFAHSHLLRQKRSNVGENVLFSILLPHVFQVVQVKHHTLTTPYTFAWWKDTYVNTHMLVQTRFYLCDCAMAGLLRDQLCQIKRWLGKNSGIVSTDQWYFLLPFKGEFNSVHLQKNLKIVGVYSGLPSNTIELQLKKFWKLNLFLCFILFTLNIFLKI